MQIIILYIDKEENISEYNVEKLHRIKDEYLNWLESSLAQSVKWDVNLVHLFYLNIPRLNETALKYGHRVELQKYNERQNLHSHGWDLNYIMLEYERLFNSLKINALDFNKIDFIHENYISSLVYFEKVKFRTTNINQLSRSEIEQVNYQFTGDLTLDPHIYFTHYNGWKLVLNINRNWVTTDTAFSYFRPRGGVSIFSGFFRVTNVDYEENIIFGSPFTIGLTPSPWDKAMREDQIPKEVENKNIKKDPFESIINMEEAENKSNYFDFSDQICDFCKKIMKNEKYLIDGATKQGPWAWMCVDCFEKYGVGIEWGTEQLYKNMQDKGWLQVSGYDNNEEDEEDFFENFEFKELFEN